MLWLFFSINYFVFGICWQIEIDAKYRDQLCGLCGNFDGIPNDMMVDGKILFSFLVVKYTVDCSPHTLITGDDKNNVYTVTFTFN